MIINSPVGRFPFEITSVRRQGSRVVLDGKMGNWPTSVEMRASDIPAVAASLRSLLVPALGAAGLAILAAKRGRSSR